MTLKMKMKSWTGGEIAAVYDVQADHLTAALRLIGTMADAFLHRNGQRLELLTAQGELVYSISAEGDSGGSLCRIGRATAICAQMRTVDEEMRELESPTGTASCSTSDEGIVVMPLPRKLSMKNDA